ncbi:MAG: glycerophosphodiester phosphodiesterase family protein [Ancrocorticia populi]|uniref:glycerophosphodiester phosphodiesterase family protein n=1 Tax=Ancrocorticia populi TaxID=2175228 RepID=UPI003F918C5A
METGGAGPLVIAHRGGANEYPENSIASFQAMQGAGFTHIETDAHATSDGVAVFAHDPELDRTTDATGNIADYTWNQLAKVRDASGNRLMRVDEVLDQFPDIIFNIDAKSDAVVDPLTSAVRRTRAVESVCLASFNERRLGRIRSALPGVTTSMGMAAIARVVGAAVLGGSGRGLLRALPGPEAGVDVAQVPFDYRRIPVLTPRFIAAAHARGIAVHAWTINDLAEVDTLVSWGIDGIITDEPTAVRNHLAAGKL